MNTLLANAPWYRDENLDERRTAAFAKALGGVGESRKGPFIEVYRTETADFALIIDFRATPLRGCSITYFHDHEQGECLERMRAAAEYWCDEK